MPSDAPVREVTVSTGARLHLGFFSYGRAGRRQFGGVGVMVDRPGFVVNARLADRDVLECGTWTTRVETLLSQLRSRQTSDGVTGRDGVLQMPVHIEVREAPPAHSGLGSGTQLGMALAGICSIFAGEEDVPAQELALRALRGRRSALGLYGFQYGGLLIEAGKRAESEISPLVARTDFPADWRFVLVRPRGVEGISGADEATGFAQLPSMPEALTGRLCRIALTEILPAVIEMDFANASAAIGEFGALVGEYFAPVQGGVFAHPQMRRLAAALASRGLRGVGQTSWGPTLFALCPGAAAAHDLVTDMSGEPAAADCDFTIAVPLNRGASVVRTPPPWGDRPA